MGTSRDKYHRTFQEYAELIPGFEAFLDALVAGGPVHVRVNTLKTTVPAVRELLARGGWETREVPWCPWLLQVLPGGEARSIGTTLLHALGHVYVQSASSAVSALCLAPRPGDRVLDLCAAPGSKTTLLAQLMEDRGLLVANEPNPRRARSLLSNLERTGIACAVVTSYSGQNLPLRVRYHRVLVDAPCSGEGTWRGTNSRPQHVSEKSRNHLTHQQGALLRRGYEVLEPGGTLVYSTCTYSPLENEGVVARLLEESDAQVLPLGLDVDALPGLTEWQGRHFPEELVHARRLYPHRFESEGFFVVRLAKP